MTRRLDDTKPVRALAALLVWTAATLAPATYGNPSTESPAIEGYSPVSYFTVGRPERGRPEHAVMHEGEVYHLTSEEQVAKFRADPERYIPAYGAYCPYNLTLGRHARIDPTNFRIYDGKLLLFHRSEEMDGAAAFDAEDRRSELLERANRQFRLFEF